MGSKFNRETWLCRIWDSQVRRSAVSAQEDRRGVALDYAAVNGIEVVLSWLNRRGFDIEFTKRSGAFLDPSRRIITVSTHLPVQKQLHMILHECGHILISGSRENKYPHGYIKIDEDRKGRDEVHKLDVLAEEFDAWYKGRRLAYRLGIVIDVDEFDKTRAKCLKTYVKWVLRRGRVADE